LDFLDIFTKNPEISNFTKIRPVGGKLIHADGRTDRETTDMMKLAVAFRKFVNAPKNKVLTAFLWLTPGSSFRLL
jgi:hypothetical protein